MAEYDMNPVTVPPVETKYRRIKTQLPVPESLPYFEELNRSEPRSMLGQPPVLWDRAEGFQVSDKWGNTWIDWSSGVLIANAGHGRKEIADAVRNQIDQSLLATYVFAHEKRVELTRRLREVSPDPEDYRVFLLTTGSEANENAIKLARTYALENHGPEKRYIVSFRYAFHGRTMGSQLAGGMENQKRWIVGEGSTFIQVPFPDGYKNEDTSFDLFLRTLDEHGVTAKQIAGVITETYQGIGPDFFPVEYAKALEAFCHTHDIVMIYDEVQAGFGRTGKMFGYQHYGVSPDLIVCGKGISSSLPISAVIGRSKIMDLYAPGSMTSTHSASPLSVAAAAENIRILRETDLIDHVVAMEEVLLGGLRTVQQRYPDVLGCLHGKGLVAGIQAVKKGTKTPDAATALTINVTCFHKGLLMFAPVGYAGECIKISPPLTITEEALRESLAVFSEACDEVLAE